MIFSKKNMRVLREPLMDNNPITFQVLGICSALAVTVQMRTALVMSLAVMSVVRPLHEGNITAAQLALQEGEEELGNKRDVLLHLIDLNRPRTGAVSRRYGR